MKKAFQILSLAMILSGYGISHAKASGDDPKKKPAKTVAADADNAGLKLPTGFGALVVAENIGRARHIVVNKQGDVYVKLTGRVNGKGITKLHDADGDGKADQITGFGQYGGTGITIKNGYLYASSDEEVFRYKLDDKENVIDTTKAEKIISGLINRRQHESKSIVLDNNGSIYVNIGAYSNSCQERDRQAGSLGRTPCPILDSAGGIWQFSADKGGQTYGDGVRYATGLRNVVGLDWNQQANQLFVMQHGRDDLHNIFPNLFTEKDNAELPAECMYALKKGDNAGWPYIYYDPFQNKKMQAPEYGGDGKKEGGKDAIDPVVAFPAHLAPNALLFYTGNMFPAKYKNGAFVAFHGSWNRAPLPQEGYYVVFVPFENGKPSGKWEIFANGFAGVDNITPRSALHRPTGLAQGPDGSLYVSDDQKGTIYRIVYNGK
ncbi:PQQ-dependent sugar dehydrogenase [Sediminibacterium soli]|uniref:PQQ-dependent sugar dehydrogenase n=1 Tax=Sediminibacterium soli TaxID=2698829 RepID=UPI00137ADF7E|nr:PQQ-dependent sugar dehydrogenase [Sediminibacterium soli]NCI46969.1 sorbosone dehydrogenase [Sediminibacterium soli]